MRPKQTILDIGVGKNPWLIRHFLDGISSPLFKLYRGVPVNTKYTCVDSRKESLKLAKENLKKHKKVVRGNVDLMLMNGSELTFEAKTFDTVILSDVLSIPPEDWCSCEDDPDCTGCKNGKVCKGCPEEIKDKIISEAIRVLKPGGKLIVAVYQTSRYAYRALDDLKKNSTISEIKNLTAGEYNVETADIYWQEKAFLKSC